MKTQHANAPLERPHAGLSAAEARRRLAQHGPNALAAAATTPIWRRFIGQFRSPLIYILLFALAFDLLNWLWQGADDWPIESFVIALILLLNAGLGLFQEYRSEQALSRLSALAAPHAWVVRDGLLVHVLSAEVVPGDIVRIEAGDRVAADGKLVESHGCMVDESVLTGESLPIEKQLGDPVLSGTLTVRGRALLEVQHTGPNSNMGRLATMLSGIEAAPTPLERRLEQFGHQIARWVLVLSLALVVGGVLAEGLGKLDHIILFAVALAVAAVPEGMPAVVTLTLSLGVQRMARRQAVVRRLAAVEALGSVTVIATDKTGTLTENRMTVQAVDSDDPDEALKAMVLANDADLVASVGDPLELALLEHARSVGANPTVLRQTQPRVAGRPFDSAWKFMRVTVQDEDGLRHSYIKGATEVVLKRSALSLPDRQSWSMRAESLAARGFRVLALAASAGDQEEGLHFLGLVSLWDPPRPEVPAAIQLAQQAGVRVLMITGDHPATACAVARTIGIAGADKALTGTEVLSLTPEELCSVVRTTTVFARVSPEQKLAIVNALSTNGEIVAVTGDGVNDAPALKRADVGIAMGQRGSDVAREVADLVLLDDNFASIVAAIEEGRGIYANIQKFIRFLFSTNVALVLLVVSGAIGAQLLDLRDASGALLLPLTAIQLLWINFLGNGPPALALGVDHNHGVMNRPPRPPKSPLLDPPSVRFIAMNGVTKAGLGAMLLIVFPWIGYNVEVTRTAVFFYESVAQLFFAYPSRRIGVTTSINPALHLAIILGTALQVLTIALPGLRVMLGLVPLDATAWTLLVVTTAATVGLAEAVNRFGMVGDSGRVVSGAS